MPQCTYERQCKKTVWTCAPSEDQYEPQCTSAHVLPTNTQVSLHIAQSAQSLICLHKDLASLVIQNAPSEDCDQTA